MGPASTFFAASCSLMDFGSVTTAVARDARLLLLGEDCLAHFCHLLYFIAKILRGQESF